MCNRTWVMSYTWGMFMMPLFLMICFRHCNAQPFACLGHNLFPCLQDCLVYGLGTTKPIVSDSTSLALAKKNLKHVSIWTVLNTYFDNAATTFLCICVCIMLCVLLWNVHSSRFAPAFTQVFPPVIILACIMYRLTQVFPPVIIPACITQVQALDIHHLLAHVCLR